MIINTQFSSHRWETRMSRTQFLSSSLEKELHMEVNKVREWRQKGYLHDLQRPVSNKM